MKLIIKKTKKEIKNKINSHVDLLKTSTNNLNNELLKILEKIINQEIMKIILKIILLHQKIKN